MRISSSKHSDYVMEFNEFGELLTHDLNQVQKMSLASAVSVSDLLTALDEVNGALHAYTEWVMMYAAMATRFKKDMILPETAYWNTHVHQAIEHEEEKDESVELWTKLGLEQIQDLREFAAMDVETTGLSNGDSIIQLSAVKFKDGEVVDTFDLFVKPSNDKAISSTITDITGITQEDVDHQETFDKVVDQFLEFMKGLVWVGHNISFDIRMFQNEMERFGLDMPAIQTLDTLQLTKELYPFWPSRGGAYKLENLKHRLDPKLISGLKSHNSLDDSKMCGWWLLELQKEAANRA